MAIQAKQVQKKINSVKNIQKITHAMELVSVSKMKKSVAKALDTRTYAKLALEILAVLSKERGLKHFLLNEGAGEKALVVMVSSDKGLCGSYNISLAKQAGNFCAALLESKEYEEIEMITIGKNAERFARRSGFKVVASFVDLPDNLRFEEVSPIIKVLLDLYKKSEYKKVFIAYTNFISALSFEQTVRQLLPVSEEVLINMIKETGASRDSLDTNFKNHNLYLFEPNEEEVLDMLLPRLSEVQVYQALLESRASENASRMVAMKNATENAGTLINDLTLDYNRARQSGVTQEISEIAAGAEAMK